MQEDLTIKILGVRHVDLTKLPRCPVHGVHPHGWCYLCGDFLKGATSPVSALSEALFGWLP